MSIDAGPEQAVRGPEPAARASGSRRRAANAGKRSHPLRAENYYSFAITVRPAFPKSLLTAAPRHWCNLTVSVRLEMGADRTDRDSPAASFVDPDRHSAPVNAIALSRHNWPGQAWPRRLGDAAVMCAQ